MHADDDPPGLIRTHYARVLNIIQYCVYYYCPVPTPEPLRQSLSISERRKRILRMVRTDVPPRDPRLSPSGAHVCMPPVDIVRRPQIRLPI